MKFILAFVFALLPMIGGAQTTSQLTGSQAKDCTANPGACQTAPVPSTCPVGKHWTLIGSAIAHCVLDDPVCPAGTTELTHDFLGNPSCFVLIISNESRSVSCPAGQQGDKEQTRTVTTHANGTKTYGSWSTSYNSCEDIPAPPPPPPAPSTCANGATNYPTCTTASAGGTCANGASNYPTCTPPSTGGGTCSNGASDYPTCTPAPAPTCSNGATNYPTCTPPTCSNGATNYPLCSVFPTPPAVMVDCPTQVIVRFTSPNRNTLCWNERTNPTPPQVPQGTACTYGAPEILNYGVRGGLMNGPGCQYN